MTATRFTPKPVQRIADILNTPTNMSIRVLRPLKGVYAHLQPEVGAIYPAVRGIPSRISGTGKKTFCWVNIRDHVVFLRGRNEIGLAPEYEEVSPDEYHS